MEKLKNIKDRIIKHKEKIIFTIILIIAIFARAYKLDSLPNGIHVDEAGIAYDAYCLATNGTDRYLHNFPVYFINFGGGQSALYTYIASLFIKIGGLNMTTVRLPALILGVLSIVASYLMTKKENSKKFALLFMFLITICPWHIMSSRWGLDCNLLAPMMIISLYLLIRTKSKKGYVLAGISFGLTLYTYALSYMILPIFLFLVLVYMLYTKRIKFINIIILGIPIFILAIPLILMLLINNGYINEISGIITINKLEEYRGAEISLNNIRKNLNFIETMLTNDELSYNAIPEYGTVYKFSIFLIIFGFGIEINNLFTSIKKGKFNLGTVFFFAFMSVLGTMLLIEGPNINKANAVYIPMMYFIASSMRCIYKNYKVFFWILIALFVIYFVRFERYYFNYYERAYKYQPYFESEYLEILENINSNENLNKKKVHVISQDAEPYIYTLFVNKTSPKDFNNLLHKDTIENDLYSYGKYYFRDRNIEDGVIYIVKNDDEFVALLQDIGFMVDEKISKGQFKVLHND